MKLLVLAQVPPPLHGQSQMVRTLLEGLPAAGVDVYHVNLGLSRQASDIGRWRIGKIAVVLDACLHAVMARFLHGCDTLYYVPAPAKRGALYRDWVVMMLCRPFFKRIVLHWHAAGLGEWTATRATAPERWLTQVLLGRADLSIVLGESLRADAQKLDPGKIAIVRNGIADPCPGFSKPAPPPDGARIAVFLGLGVAEKGVLDAIEAVHEANRRDGASRWRLRLAGEIPDPEFAQKIQELTAASAGSIEHVGFVTGDRKRELLSTADALLFPTYYPAETQGLVVAEAMAYDLPVVLTDWRAVAENVPVGSTYVVSPRSPREIADALAKISRQAPSQGAARRHFLEHYTDRAFSARMQSALESIQGESHSEHGGNESVSQIHRQRWQGVWRNFGTSMLARAVAAACMLAQVPLAMRQLGVEGFGVWMALAGFAGLMQIADFGLGISAQNQMAAAFGRRDETTFAAILRRAGLWTAVLAVALSLVLAPLCWHGPWSEWLNLDDPALAPQLPFAALAALLGFVINQPLSLASRIALARQQAWLIPQANCVASVSQLAAVACAVWAQASLSVFVLIGSLGPVLQNLMVLALVPRTEAPSETNPSPPVPVSPSLWWQDSLKFFLPQAASTTATFFLPIALSVLSGPIAVTQVNLLQRLFGLLTQAHLMIIGPLWPAYAEAQARNDREWIRRSFHFSLKITGLFLTGLIITACLTPWLVDWWLGGGSPALPPLLIAAVAAWFCAQTACQPLSHFLGGLNHPAGMAIYGTASQLMAIGAACWVGPQYGAVGIVGAAALIIAGVNLPAAAIESAWLLRRVAPSAGAAVLPASLRRFLARRLAGPDPRPARTRLKVCIFKVDRIGDFVLATGAIRRLLAAHGEENCLLFISHTVAELAAREFPRTRRVTVPPQAAGLLREMAAIRRESRRQLGEYQFEQLVCLRHQRTLYHDLLLTWVKADRWIGLTPDAPRVATLDPAHGYTLPARYPRTIEAGCSRDLVAHGLIVSDSVGTFVPAAGIQPSLTVGKVEPGSEFLVLPFSSDPVRNYPAPLLAEALGRANLSGPLVLSGTEAQREALEELAGLARSAGASGVSVDTDPASPLALVDRVARARAVLSMDSAAAHIATALDRPAVIIQGGGEWELMSPWGARRRQYWVHHPLPCFNCDWHCRFDRTLCLTDIPPRMVTQAINDALAHS
jgi:glycosyltransferase involved in cell wall biosynthesis/O-antigen/teichoic acid export membrane protein/ADP-heptose:LPS heptosyltransferase